MLRERTRRALFQSQMEQSQRETGSGPGLPATSPPSPPSRCEWQLGASCHRDRRAPSGSLRGCDVRERLGGPGSVVRSAWSHFGPLACTPLAAFLKRHPQFPKMCLRRLSCGKVVGELVGGGKEVMPPAGAALLGDHPRAGPFRGFVQCQHTTRSTTPHHPSGGKRVPRSP